MPFVLLQLCSEATVGFGHLINQPLKGIHLFLEDYIIMVKMCVHSLPMFQLLQQLEERKTLDMHIHHDNAILQAKVNSLQWLVDEMTKTDRNLRAQLKQHRRY